MKEQVDPKLYGLPARTILMKKGPGEFILVIDRKSRIIMKDALTILKKAEQIKGKDQNALVVLETSAPVLFEVFLSWDIFFMKNHLLVFKLIT